MASTLPPATVMDWVKMTEAKLIIEELKLLSVEDNTVVALLSQFPVIRQLAQLKQNNQPLFEHTWAYTMGYPSIVMIFGIDGREYRLSVKSPTAAGK